MTPALLLAGHGSRSTAGVEEYFALAARVRALAPDVAVGTGFIELASPPVTTAATDLAADGHDHIVVLPLMLLGAGHAKTDVPGSITVARRRLPGVRFTYGRQLGVHPDLLAVVDERLAVAIPATGRADTAVLVVGRGSSDPDANADLHKVARLLWEGRDWPLVEVAFVGITRPRIVEGLERLRLLGATRVAVVPYFLFTGVLEERIRAQAAAYAADHPGVEVTVTGHLGPDDRIARLVLDRYTEALTGGALMNCDACVHRTPLPGFADKVGLPQVPHAHPDEGAHTHGPAHG